MDANKVGRWRVRVAKEGTSSIEKERPRGANHGGKNTKKQAQLRSEVIEATTQTTPNDATHWSCRLMARHLNTTHSFVNRVWRAHGLKPHLIRTFKLSNDPRFEEKLRDVVGLYLDPPHNAAVFSFDEKSQIQALDRTQPGLAMKKGRCATMTHDYKRHGTTTLFAALNMATGEVIGKTYRKHRHQEVLRFLREVEKTVPKEPSESLVKRSTSSWTTTRRTNTRRCSHGSNARSASSSTSSRPARLGPIWSSGSLGFSRKNRFVEVSLHRCRIWRSACASTWRATTRIHAPWSGQSPSRKSSKRSVGVARSYLRHLNHYFVKDTTLDGISFISESDICTASHEPAGTTYTIVGYPNSKNKKTNATKRLVYTEQAHYSDVARTNQTLSQELNLSHTTHIFMNYDPKHSRDAQGQCVNSIQLKGMSGGPVFNIGVLPDPSVLGGCRHPDPCLIGLFTEFHRKQKMMIATRVQTILHVVSQRLLE